MCDTHDSVYNLWTSSSEENEPSMAAPKKRGRPIGSKNKPKDNDAAHEPPTTPKKRGRPSGSKNKPKDNAPKTAPVTTKTPNKRSADKHTRKSKRSMAAATTIQRYARRYINEYTMLIAGITD